MTILEHNIEWGIVASIIRRHKSMCTAVTIQRLCDVKSLLATYLKEDDNIKEIVSRNSAASFEYFQTGIDGWFDNPDTIKDDTLLIKELLESDWKFKVFTTFTLPVTDLKY